MEYIEQGVFILLLSITASLFARRANQIRVNILLGKDDVVRDNKSQRWKNMFMVAFGQKKMFKRPVPAVLHFVIYISFLIINLELLEIICDGILGSHRVFSVFLGSFYRYLINSFEILAVFVIISCVVFLIRRNIVRLKRFHKPEMSKWPTLDANLILVFEIVLMLFFLNMNATDAVLVESIGGQQSFIISDMFVGLYDNLSFEMVSVFERIFWWLHIIGIFFFANYVLLSKHLHIFLAFPATYFASLENKGKVQNMDEVTTEVKIMLGLEQSTPNDSDIPRFGIKDVEDLSWKHLLNAYTCTECGRCTDNCPANITGKKLSPRKIMMDVRNRMEELGSYKAINGVDSHDGLSLIDNYITEEELNACTTCNACTQSCPINLNPLEIIIEARRYKAMEESKGPSGWMSMYQNIETNFSPWKMPIEDRFKWKEDLSND